MKPHVFLTRLLFVVLAVFVLAGCEKKSLGQNEISTPASTSTWLGITPVSTLEQPTNTPIATIKLPPPLVCPEILPTREPKPDFWEDVSPVGSVTKAEYDALIGYHLLNLDEEIIGGLKATIILEGIYYGNDDVWFRNKITVLVNGVDISDAPAFIGHGLMPHGPLYYNWLLDLNPGYYEATLIFDMYSGETVKYSWTFCIVP